METWTPAKGAATGGPQAFSAKAAAIPTYDPDRIKGFKHLKKAPHLAFPIVNLIF